MEDIKNKVAEIINENEGVGFYNPDADRLAEKIDILYKEHYGKQLMGVRAEAIGWTHADSCVDLDNGKDPRKKCIPDMLKRANIDLNPIEGQ